MSRNTKEQNERHTKILMDLLKQPDNKECAECTAKGPRWASATLGVFVCLRCSGIHRNLGTHISFVRSVTLDTWNPDHVKNMQRMGNAKAKLIWEATCTAAKPDENADVRVVEKWIRDKYVKQLYKSKDGLPQEEEEEKPKKRESRRNGRHRHDSSDDEDTFERPTSTSTPSRQQPVATPRPTSAVRHPTRQPVTASPARHLNPNTQMQVSASSPSLIDFDLGMSTTGSSSQPTLPPSRPASAPVTPHAEYHAPSQTKPAQPASADLLVHPEASNTQMKDSILSLFHQPAPAAQQPYRSPYQMPQGGYGGYAQPGYPVGRGMPYQQQQPQNPASYYGTPNTGYQSYGYNNAGYNAGYNGGYQQPR